ncbi:MAG: class I SAM-dependent methyltransferase [Actinomycetota bacterium]|nr:class I SAM-dependent methyltransferase [Actinomycetota bacterium]
MTDAAGSWSASFGAAPAEAMAVYEDVFVPRLFVPHAQVLLDELQVQPGERVLDVACGPGTVALLAAARVGPQGRVTACDISPAMLDIARAKAGADAVEWVETPAAPLAGIAEESYDVATCQQGLQFFPDRLGALAEMRRALAPGGRAGVATWTAIEESPAFAALAAAIAGVLGAELAARYRGRPWGLHEADELAGLLRQAGFADVSVVQRTTTGLFEGGAGQLVRTLAAAAVAPEVAALGEEGYARLVAAAARHMEPLTDPAGVTASFTTNIAFGTRP